MLLLRSRRNCVLGNGSASGSQSASRSRVSGSKRLGGLLSAPRAGDNGWLAFTKPKLNGVAPACKHGSLNPTHCLGYRKEVLLGCPVLGIAPRAVVGAHPPRLSSSFRSPGAWVRTRDGVPRYSEGLNFPTSA